MSNLSYPEAKKEIRRVGYGRCEGDSLILANAEILSNHFKLSAMGGPKTSAKKIYEYLLKFNIDFHKLIHYVVGDKTRNNIWVLWNGLLDDKEIKI